MATIKSNPLFLWSICILFFIPKLDAQTGFLYQSRIPFYVNLIPFLGKKDSIPNMVSVDYQYHEGICKLGNGKTLTGWFKFQPYGSRYDFFMGNKLKRREELLHKPTADSRPDTVEFDEIQKLVLAGRDSMVFTGTDSTVFTYSEKSDKFLRLRAEKPVRFYDDQLIVDELDKHHLTFWTYSSNLYAHPAAFGGGVTMNSTNSFKRAKAVWEWVDYDIYRQLRTTDEIFYEMDGKLSRIKNWDDAVEKFPVDPYILKVAEILRKENPRDIAFGIFFTYFDNKIALLPFFTDAELELVDGRTLKGLGFIQPYRTDGFEKTGYFHFYDGKNFNLFDPEEIKRIKINDRMYQPVFDSFNKRYYLGFTWKHDDETYRILQGTYIEGKSGFFNQGGEPQFQILRQKKNGNHVVETDKDLRRAFISEKRNSALAE